MVSHDEEVKSLMLDLLEGFIWFDQQLQAHLDSEGMPTVNRTESMIMLLAGSGVRRPTELAKKLGLARQTINSSLRALETKKLIRLVVDPEDRRCKYIEPAASGKKMYAVAQEGLQLSERTLQSRIGVRRFEALATSLAATWR
ncbi:MAG: MarR family transcriptional regulator [Pseudomonadota bacterium]